MLKWGPMTIRVFLLDDHEIVRTGLRSLLESDRRPRGGGEAGTVAEALSRIPALQPDVAILDVRLPDGSGVEVCRDIRSSMPDHRLHHAHLLRRRRGAVRRRSWPGSSGYVLKQVGGSSLVDDVRRVAAGESLLDPALTDRVLRRLREGPEEEPLLASLTHQERRILDLIAEGKTNRQIAEAMFLAEKTVKNYVSNLLTKLGMERRTQAAAYATRIHERSERERRTDATGT